MSLFDKVRFEVTEDHLKLIKRMYVKYNAYCEFGAPEIDPKRPYGNSSVYRDIAEILDIIPEIPVEDDDDLFTDAQENQMKSIHEETTKALQVAVRTLSFKAGIYEADEYHENWVFIG